MLTLENFLIDQSNIAWPTDRAVRFGTNNITEEIAKNETSPPPFWTRDLSEIESKRVYVCMYVYVFLRNNFEVVYLEMNLIWQRVILRQSMEVCK